MPKEKFINIINNISITLLTLTAFAVPLFFLPLSRNFYTWNKQVLILGVGLILLILWGVKVLLENEVKIFKQVGRLGKAEWALIALPVLYLASTLLNPGYTEGLMGRTMLFLGVLLFYFASRQILITKSALSKFITYPLLVSVVLLSVLNILDFFNIAEKIITLPGITNPGWSPTGGQFALVTLSLTALPILIKIILREFKKDEEDLQTSAFLFSFFSLPLIAASLAVFAINVFETERLLKNKAESAQNVAKYANYIQTPLNSGWKVATRVLGNTPKTAFFGVGPQNFENAFRRHKPVSITQTPFWNVVFSQSTNEPFHLITTSGLLGFLAWAGLCFYYGGYLYAKRKREKPIKAAEISLAVLLLIQFVLPPTLISWFLVYLLFLIITTEETELAKYKLQVDPKVILASTTAFSALLAFLTIRAYRAEAKIYKSNQKPQKGSVEETLTLQKKAIALLPENAHYHYLFSRTNLTIAQSIEQRKENLKTIDQLLQYSRQAAERAINYNPTNADYWKIRGDAFWNLVGIQEGAAQSAMDSYNQAIARDPLNPTLRVLRGKVWTASQNWQRAQEDLVLALRINPELPSAWYNLALVLEGQEDFQNAVKALEKTLELLPSRSQSYNTVKSRIEKLEKNVPSGGAAAEEGEPPAAEKEPKDENLEEILEQDVEKQASPSATTESTSPEKESTPSAEKDVKGEKTNSPFGSEELQGGP